MKDNDIKYPKIAMIVSDNLDHCRRFLATYNLNPRCFILCTDVPHIMGIKRDMPVIITYHGNNDRFWELLRAIENRFTNIRYMDY
jgi:hypothetical protein